VSLGLITIQNAEYGPAAEQYLYKAARE